jgi:hypothetical protein
VSPVTTSTVPVRRLRPPLDRDPHRVPGAVLRLLHGEHASGTSCLDVRADLLALVPTTATIRVGSTACGRRPGRGRSCCARRCGCRTFMVLDFIRVPPPAARTMTVRSPRRERFYWGTVLLTFGLGTALGDTTAANLHLGFAWSIAIFGALILLPLLAWKAGADTVVCFWIAYALTRPLGASIADGMAVRPQHGGLGWGTGPVTAVGLVLFTLLVGYIAITRSDSPVDEVDPSAGHPEHEAVAARELDLATD